MYRLQEDTVVFRHIKDSAGAGVMTLAMYITGNKLQYGYAACAEKDQFSKETGRVLAEERLWLKVECKIPVLGKGSGALDDTVHRVLCHIYAQGEYPKHIRDTLTLLLRNKFYYLA